MYSILYNIDVPDLIVDDFDCADCDTVLIEYGDESNNYLFDIPKIEFKMSKCDWCNNKKMLTYVCKCKDVWYCTERCKESDFNNHLNVCKKIGDEDYSELKMTEKSKMGLVGLQNLGNTCFMSTALQCISNCWELTNYFLKNHYKNDINLVNPLGTKGILTRNYANLLKNVWYGEAPVFAPWGLKRAISSFHQIVYIIY